MLKQSTRRGHWCFASASHRIIKTGWRYWMTVAVGALLYLMARSTIVVNSPSPKWRTETAGGG